MYPILGAGGGTEYWCTLNDYDKAAILGGGDVDTKGNEIGNAFHARLSQLSFNVGVR